MSTQANTKKTKTAVPPSKPRLILTHGEKGGVGKTTVARLIADYLTAQDLAFRAFDAEGENGQLLRFYPSETLAVEVDKATAIAPVLDYLMDGRPNRLALVDLGARTGHDLREWLYKGGALEEAEGGQLGITLVYVLGGALDSVAHLKECLAALGTEVEYVVVKNFGVAPKFDTYEASPTRRELMSAGANEIDIPALDSAVYQSVDKASVPFSAFCDGQGTTAGYTEKRYCRTWLRECFAQLDEVNSSLQ